MRRGPAALPCPWAPTAPGESSLGCPHGHPQPWGPSLSPHLLQGDQEQPETVGSGGVAAGPELGERPDPERPGGWVGWGFPGDRAVLPASIWR